MPNLSQAASAFSNVVSANYLKRNDRDHRWLIRAPSEPAKSAKPFKCVIAAGVTFGPSSIEEGFGCSTVAYCKVATGSDTEISNDETGLVRLRFNGLRFMHGDEVVTECQMLYLNADGSMFAVLVPKKDAARDDIMLLVNGTAPLDYSSPQRDDEFVGRVSDRVLRLAATHVRLVGEVEIERIRFGIEPDSDRRLDIGRGLERKLAQLEVVKAMYGHQLRLETSVWDGRQITLRAGGRAVVTATDRKQHEAMLSAINRSTTLSMEARGGGNPAHRSHTSPTTHSTGDIGDVIGLLSALAQSTGQERRASSGRH